MDLDNTRIVMTKRQLLEFLKLVPFSQRDLSATGDDRATFRLRYHLPRQVHRHYSGHQLVDLLQASTLVTLVAKGMIFDLGLIHYIE